MQAPPATPLKKGKQPGMLVLILDEMDQLISQDCTILYTLFSLPQVCPLLAPNSREEVPASLYITLLPPPPPSPTAPPLTAPSHPSLGQFIRHSKDAEVCYLDLEVCKRLYGGASPPLLFTLSACSTASPSPSSRFKKDARLKRLDPRRHSPSDEI